jgi:hypothetical protein
MTLFVAGASELSKSAKSKINNRNGCDAEAAANGFVRMRRPA